MKQFKKYVLPLTVAAILGAGVCLASCEKDEGTATPKSRDLTHEIKLFHESARKAASLGTVSPTDDEKSIASKRLKLMVEDAKELIYATGVSERELNELYSSDEAIVRQALDICVEQSKNHNKQ